jgi:RHS repeat-associated protein
VKKYVPSTGETTIFVYDAGGKLVAEYSTIVARVEDAKVAYLTNDHLGSPRINTDKNGNVTARHDYHPFGEEIATSQRTASLHYSEDTVRKQFTGYERDLEVDLDYAKARMHASKLGRFTTTDPSQKSVDRMSPQTWNRYTYCYNNPLTLVDENGKWPTGTHSRIINQALNTMSEKFRSAVRWGSIKTDYPGTVLERNAHKHAMTPASYITKTCDVDCAKGKARQAATEFVNANLNKAAEKFKEAQKYGQGSDQGVALVKESLTYFGRAIHTVMDNVSPAHGGFQIFTGYTTTFATNAAMGAASGGGIAGALVSGVAGTAQDISDHNKTEERDPTPQEYDVMSDRIRVLFQEVYGQDAYNSSVSEEERKKTRERSSQPGFSVVF